MASEEEYQKMAQDDARHVQYATMELKRDRARQSGDYLLESRDGSVSPDSLMMDIDSLVGDSVYLEQWLDTHSISEVRYTMLAIEDNAEFHRQRATMSDEGLNMVRSMAARLSETTNKPTETSRH